MTPIPYAGTNVPAEVTQGQITKLLYKAGAEATRWSATRDGQTELAFVFPVKGHKVAFRIAAPLLADRYGKPKPNETMRLLYWWLKSQVEAIQYGLMSVEEAFLAQAVASLEGQTVAEILLPRLRSGYQVLPALPEPEKEP